MSRFVNLGKFTGNFGTILFLISVNHSHLETLLFPFLFIRTSKVFFTLANYHGSYLFSQR